MILLNDFKRQWNAISQDAQRAFTRVGESGWYILGQEVSSFERALSREWGLTSAIGCANGLDAIELSLRCLGVKAGDSVLTTPLSAFATTLAIMRLGASPVFVDVDSSGLIDLDQMDAVLEKNPSIRAAVPVHLFGHCLDLSKLERIKKKHDLKIVEDCAQSIGASHDSRPCGSVGQMTATSFYPTKNLGCMGDGGAILTSDPALETRARALRDYGQSEKYVHTYFGANSRLDEVQAAILQDAFLPRLKGWTENRRRIAQAYLRGIKNPAIELPSTKWEQNSSWHLFPVLCPSSASRDRFMAHLKGQGVASAVHYPVLISDQQALKEYGKFAVHGSLENSRRYATTEVSLPIHPFLTDAEIQKVIDTCNAWRAE